MDNLNAWNENTTAAPEHYSIFFGNTKLLAVDNTILIVSLTLPAPQSNHRTAKSQTKLIAENSVFKNLCFFDFSGYLLEWRIGRRTRTPKIDVLNSMLGGFLRLTRFWLFINDNRKEKYSYSAPILAFVFTLRHSLRSFFLLSEGNFVWESRGKNVTRQVLLRIFI